MNGGHGIASIDGAPENVTKTWMRAVLGATLSAPLICAACHREAAAPAPVDQMAACASPGTLAQLKATLLQAPDTRASSPRVRRYLERMAQAQITLSDVALGSYDPSSGEAHCTAVAHLASPLALDAAVAAERISYTTRPEPDGRASLSGLRGPEGGNYDQFAKLLQQQPKPSQPKPVAAPTTAAAAPDVNTVGDEPPHPATALSDETQRLVDQAGDTRAWQNTETPAETAEPNSVSNTTR